MFLFFKKNNLSNLFPFTTSFPFFIFLYSCFFSKHLFNSHIHEYVQVRQSVYVCVVCSIFVCVKSTNLILNLTLMQNAFHLKLTNDSLTLKNLLFLGKSQKKFYLNVFFTIGDETQVFVASAIL